jgi:hypothetical protein
MSNFKVLAASALTAREQRDTVLPRPPQLLLPSQIALLNYPIDQLREQV